MLSIVWAPVRFFFFFETLDAQIFGLISLFVNDLELEGYMTFRPKSFCLLTSRLQSSSLQ
jgi:hypothetical protein